MRLHSIQSNTFHVLLLNVFTKRPFFFLYFFILERLYPYFYFLFLRYISPNFFVFIRIFSPFMFLPPLFFA